MKVLKQRLSAYLKQSGRLLLPFRRTGREGYHYQKHPLSDHIINLDRFLPIALSLITENPTLIPFYIRHPKLQPGNIINSKNFHVFGLIEWQHTSIPPPFFLARIFQQLQNYDWLVLANYDAAFATGELGAN